MASLTTFDITLADLQQHVNPSLDLNGIQIGALFTLTSVVASAVRTTDTSLTLAPGLPLLGVNQLEGYRIYLNDVYSTAYNIIANSQPNANGSVVIRVQETLPAASGNWKVVCRHTRVDLSDVFAQDKIEDAVRYIKSQLSVDYSKMLRNITGQLLWAKDLGGYGGHDDLTIPLAFYAATNLAVFSNLQFDYSNRREDADLLVEGTDYTVTNDSEAKTSTLTLTAPPEVGTVIACDYAHTLDPMPKSLKSLALDAAKSRILQHFASVRSDITFDMIKELNEYIKEGLKIVPEFDEIELYQETRKRPRHGFGEIKLFRG